MHILKDGRAPFLEFLRNLTPQTVILTFVLVQMYPLAPTCCYPENALRTALVVAFVLIWLAAVWANSSLFIEKYLVAVERIDQVSRRLVRRGVTGMRNLRCLLRFAWRHERMVFVELVVVFVVVELGLTVTALSAISSAVGMLKVLHG